MIGRAFVLVVATGALASAPFAHAHFAERQSSLSSYAETAELVVRGVVEGSEQTFERGHSPRDASATLRVEEVLKGTAPSDRLRFETVGVHQPSYRTGKHVLLFLNRVPGSDPPRLVTRQNAIEGADLDGAEGAPLLAAVRGYLAIARIADPRGRGIRLKQTILRELDSPAALLWQNALFDLSKRPDLIFDGTDVAELERLAGRNDKPPILRVGCIAKLGALGKAGDASAARALTDVMAMKGALIVRTMAAAALADTRSPLARPALVRMLDDPAMPMRRAAAEALGRLAEAAAVDPLADLAARDSNPSVRFAALKAIASIGDARAERVLGTLPARSPFADTSRAIDLARREVAQHPQGREKR